MLKSDRNDTTHMPIWLAAACAVALAFRLLTLSWEAHHPVTPTRSIAWQPLSVTTISFKPVLLYFSTPWSKTCANFESDCLSNRDIVDLINSTTIPIHIVDRSLEPSGNSIEVQNVENKYNTHVFPTVVIAMPDGTFLDSIGATSHGRFTHWLKEALVRRAFVEGSEAFAKGNFATSELLMERYINDKDADPITLRFARLRRYVSLVCLHRDNEAKAVYDEALKHEHDKLPWPYPLTEAYYKGCPYNLLKCLAGNFPYEQLDKTNEYDSASYLALIDWSRGDYASCAKHIERALVTSPSKSYWSYRAARSLLPKLPANLREPLIRQYFY
jgi:hypothetical protein